MQRILPATLLLCGCLMGETYVPQPVTSTEGWYSGVADDTDDTDVTGDDDDDDATGDDDDDDDTGLVFPLACVEAHETGCSAPVDLIDDFTIEAENVGPIAVDVRYVSQDCVEMGGTTLQSGEAASSPAAPCSVYRFYEAGTDVLVQQVVVDAPVVLVELQ